MGSNKGIRDSIRELMGSKKNKLFTTNDLVKGLGLEYIQANTTLYQMWKKGDIFQHIEKDIEHGHRYAINIAEGNFKPYEQTRFLKSSVSREPVTKEDVEVFFQDFQNACLIFDSLLTKAMELETRLINNLEESDKAVTLLHEMKARINF